MISLLALFVALTGTGIAATALTRNSVKSKHIAPRQVKRSDLAANAVVSKKVKNNSLKGADIAEATLVGLPDAIGRSNQGPSCVDDASVGEECVTVSVTLPRPGRVLLIATSAWHTENFDDPVEGSDGPTVVEGVCRLRADSSDVPGTQRDVGENLTNAADVQWTAGPTFGGGGTLATTGVTGVLAAGPHQFALRCLEEDGDIDWFGANLSAVALGSG